jgi:hypothetical protein
MAHPRSEHTHARPRHRSNWIIWTLIAVLLAAVLAGTLWLPIYNRTTPALGGFPFFYWYQLLWVPVVALVSWGAYALSRYAQRGTAPAGTPPTPPAPAAPLSAPTATEPPLRPAGPAPGQTARPAPGPPPPLPKRQVPPRTEGD